MNGRWLFLAAYTCSGLAGLIYEISWTRLLTLHMGHTTAAASTVLTAFMAGLGGGAVVGGRFAHRLTPRQALLVFVALEMFVAGASLIVPLALSALAPLLRLSYNSDQSAVLFPMIRLVACVAVLLPPTLALGATFPVAVRWFVHGSERPHTAAGALYAANTTGAAIGALAAGFALIPLLGLTRTTLVAMSANGVSIVAVLIVALVYPGTVQRAVSVVRTARVSPLKWRGEKAKRTRSHAANAQQESSQPAERFWLAAAVLALTGLATFMYEVAWTRVFSMIIGPSTYAFSAMLAGLIVGLAAGSVIGTLMARWARNPAVTLALILAGTAILANWACSFAGGPLPRLVAQELARSSQTGDETLLRHSLLVGTLILPIAAGLGAAFPLALNLAGGRDRPARQFGAVYAANTLGAVTGALAAGFVTIPLVGLQDTLRLASVGLVAATVLLVAFGRPSPRARLGGGVVAAAALASLIVAPAWDRELLASGVYKYAPYVADNLDVETALEAGTLLYYRDAAAATVSVKRLTGVLSLAIDGKVDASTGSDMLTQKALAHLPLLLHPEPRDVFLLGLGSGVTLASALLHPVESVDVVEISPEVVEASRFFDRVNRNAIDDPRAHLILGDGRSHAMLSARKYDVIISEPSNPWMAGVSALFTREFFLAARDRLAPGGIVCQWAHTYDMTDSDLRSIVRTFVSVFPEGTMWLIGEGDLLLIASTEPLGPRLGNLQRGWTRPAVMMDLREVSALEPFALWSLFIGGPQQLERYSAGASLQTDDRMALEFSAPRALYAGRGTANATALRSLFEPTRSPPPIARAFSAAGADQWRMRADMMWKADAYATAYGDYATALTHDPADMAALDGLVRAADATGREGEALHLLQSSLAAHPRASIVRVAISRLQAATGAFDQAIITAQEASRITPADPEPLEQLAALLADTGDADALDSVASRLQRLYPDRPRPYYYAAASMFIRGRFPEAAALARQAIARDAQYGKALNLLGAIQANLGQVEKAREAFHAAAGIDPRDSTVYANLGLLELSSQNRTVAAELFLEALSLDPASQVARTGLEQARAGGGQ
jgi:spermidine synthase